MMRSVVLVMVVAVILAGCAGGRSAGVDPWAEPGAVKPYLQLFMYGDADVGYGFYNPMTSEYAIQAGRSVTAWWIGFLPAGAEVISWEVEILNDSQPVLALIAPNTLKVTGVGGPTTLLGVCRILYKGNVYEFTSCCYIKGTLDQPVFGDLIPQSSDSGFTLVPSPVERR